jgi:adenine-specific DNA-methyltransferase
MTIQKLTQSELQPDLDEVGLVVKELRKLSPELFTESTIDGGQSWKIDFDLLKGKLQGWTEDQQERYGFTWNGKVRARRIAQTPSTGTLRPCPEESVNWDTTQNLFIEGDNLEVLKLLQKSYHRKVKMIYIDPPYNTGKEFIYPDKFQDNLDTYLKYTGQVDTEGLKLSANAETSGRYHTNWLNMMLPRLKLARNLLREDGVIAISIDDTEMANLIKLCTEVYGEENHLATIVWQKRYVSNVTAKWLSDMHDFVVLFARNRESVSVNPWERSEKQLEAYRNPDTDPRGRWRAQDLSASKPYSAGQFAITGPTGKLFDPPPNRYWRCNQEQFGKWSADNRIWWGVNRDARPMLKSFLSESDGGITPHTWWEYGFAGHNKEATLEMKALFDGDSPFDTPKPVKLMRRLLELVCTDEDLVLDFFAGSAPLAQAVLELNANEGRHHRFIMAQLPEPTERPDYASIADIAKERIRRAVAKVLSEIDGHLPVAPGHDSCDSNSLGFRVFQLGQSNIKAWDADFDNVEQAVLESADNIKSDRSEQDVLYELLLKFGLDLCVPIEERGIAGKKVYSVGAGALIVCLDTDITLDVVEGIAALKDELKPEVMRVVFRDSGFKDDVVKTNAVQILKQAGLSDEHIRSI